MRLRLSRTRRRRYGRGCHEERPFATVGDESSIGPRVANRHRNSLWRRRLRTVEVPAAHVNEPTLRVGDDRIPLPVDKRQRSRPVVASSAYRLPSSLPTYRTLPNHQWRGDDPPAHGIPDPVSGRRVSASTSWSSPPIQTVLPIPWLRSRPCCRSYTPSASSQWRRPARTRCCPGSRWRRRHQPRLVTS